MTDLAYGWATVHYRSEITCENNSNFVAFNAFMELISSRLCNLAVNLVEVEGKEKRELSTVYRIYNVIEIRRKK